MVSTACGSRDYIDKKIQDNYLDKEASQLMALFGFVKNVSKDFAAAMFLCLDWRSQHGEPHVCSGEVVSSRTRRDPNTFEIRPEGLKKQSHSNKYTAAIPHFFGTPSYLEFGEVWDIEGPNGHVKGPECAMKFTDRIGIPCRP